jgi:hypothetical protein
MKMIVERNVERREGEEEAHATKMEDETVSMQQVAVIGCGQ